MAEPKSDVRPAPASRQALQAADREELIERIEALQADLQRRMDTEEEILHLNLQKGTASLQSQVEEASQRFRVAQQELEAFRLEVLDAAGDPAGKAPRPYVFEDLSAPPQEGPQRSALRGILSVFRRLRDERDRFRDDLGIAQAEAARLSGELAAEQLRREKAAAELSTLGVSAADLDVVQKQLRQETEAARAEADRLREELARERSRPGAPEGGGTAESPGGSDLGAARERLLGEASEARSEAHALRVELERERTAAERALDLVAGLRRERGQAESERDRMEQEKADARADAEKARLELQGARDAQARAAEEASSLRAAGEDLDREVERLRDENARLEEQATAQLDEQAELGRRLAYAHAQSDEHAAKARDLVQKFAEKSRLLEEARFQLEHPDQTVGFEKFEKFLGEAKLRALLEKSVRGPKRAGRAPAAQMIVEIVGAVVGAQEQPLESARNLIPRITRPRRSPTLAELRRLIEGLKAPELQGVRRVHDALRASFFAPARKPEILTVDLDMPELLIGGSPQGSASYWPAVMYVPELQEFWNGRLRTAAEMSPKEMSGFLAEGLARAPSKMEKNQLRIRMDSRFYDDAMIRLLESKDCSYVIVPPDSAEIRSAARSCAFSGASEGWEAGEWMKKGGSGRASGTRFVTLRHSRTAEPPPGVPFLFRDPQYAYRVFAVDRRISPREALETFASRETAQEREHALLRDFSQNRLLARGPEAHAKFFPLFLLALDLVQWYRRSAP